jgi:endonuclease/exonuclease/phosphatase family metal-dependent hydrolase
LWRAEVKVSQLYAHPNYIDVRIEENVQKIWRFTGMYGEFKWRDKYKTWQRIRDMHSRHNLPWILIGDLNEILYDHEKEGGRVRPQQFMQAFQDTLTDCGLDDLGYVGDRFTWHRGNIRERLDRGFGNSAWIDMHPEAAVVNLEYNHSDHRPLS